MTAMVAAKPANVLSISGKARRQGWYFGSWEGLGGGIVGKSRKEVEARRTNPGRLP